MDARKLCDFSHDTSVCTEKKSVAAQMASSSFKCIGCKSQWEECSFVVKHTIQNMEIFFCLNCEDWVKDKSRVLDHGWSLFDEDGNLNQFV